MVVVVNIVCILPATGWRTPFGAQPDPTSPISHSMDDSAHSEHSFPDTQRDPEILAKLFDDDISNEETLLTLSTLEHASHFALKTSLIQSRQFDYLKGLLNLLRRLSHLDDQVVNQLMGIEDEGDNVSIISFIFKIINEYFERICLTEMVELSDMYLSLYDYCCVTMCSFILTLNEDQLNVVEEVLLENLLSTNTLCALLASDVICFLCRIISTSDFPYHICHVIFSLLSSIYVKDVHIEDKSHEAYLSCNLVQEVLLNLLNRIVPCLGPDELDLLKSDFPFEEYLFIWKNMTNVQFDCGTLENLSSNENCMRFYDELHFMRTNVLELFEELVPSLVNNFLSSDDHYYDLLCLRLCADTTSIQEFHIPYDQASEMFEKIISILSQRTSLYGKFSYEALRLLKGLSVSEDPLFQNEQFFSILGELALVLYEGSSCYASKYQFFQTLDSLSQNSLFESFVYSLSNFNLKRDYNLLLEHLDRGKFMRREERELYVRIVLTKSHNSNLNDIDYENALCDANLYQINLSLSKRHSEDDSNDYTNCKRLKYEQNDDSDELIYENGDAIEDVIIRNLEASIDLFRDIVSISDEKKKTLSHLSGQLDELIQQL